MKAYFIILLAFLTLLQGVSAQNDKQIKKIDKIVLKIKNSLTAFQKNDQKLKDTTVTEYVYMEGKELQLVTLYIKDNNIIKNIGWYFSDKKLIYAEQTMTDPTTKNVVNHERSYLADWSQIAWMKSNNMQVDANSEEFKEHGIKLVEYGKKLESTFENNIKENKK